MQHTTKRARRRARAANRIQALEAKIAEISTKTAITAGNQQSQIGKLSERQAAHIQRAAAFNQYNVQMWEEQQRFNAEQLRRAAVVPLFFLIGGVALAFVLTSI